MSGNERIIENPEDGGNKKDNNGGDDRDRDKSEDRDRHESSGQIHRPRPTHGTSWQPRRR
jgi:hypothetical protein